MTMRVCGRVAAVLVTLVLVGCDEFNPPAWSDGGDSGGDGPVDAGADLAMDLENGARCVKAGQCTSGNCVDDVCCATACEGECTSCAVEGKQGRCEPVPAGQDPRGDCVGSDAECNGACNGTSGCIYPKATTCGTATCADAELTENFCNGGGTCSPSEPVSCGGYLCEGSSACKQSCTQLTEDADCDTAADFKCIDGHCANPQPLGSECGDNDYACDSGYCTDGVCCTSDTCLPCQHCGTDGQCTPDDAGPAPAGECPGDASCNAGQCDGLGNCAYHAPNTVCGQSCTAGQSTVSLCNATGTCNIQPTVLCAPYICAGDVCGTSCAEHTDCITGALCDRTTAHSTGGVCIDPGNIVDASPGTLQTTIDNLTPPFTHIRVTAGLYLENLSIADKTVALIGDGDVDIKSLTADVPGIDIDDGGNVTVQGLTIRNAYGDDGTGIKCAPFWGDAAVTVLDSTIYSNVQGIESYDCDVTVRRSRIENNDDGGLQLQDGTFVLVNNVIENNGTSGVGGSYVGGVYIMNAKLTFVNNTVVWNRASDVSVAGIYCDGIGYTIYNSIFWGNKGWMEYANCNFDHSNFEGTVPPGAGNQSQDCQIDAEMKIDPSSICADGGNSSAPGISQIDITSGPRIKGTAVDMGAFEVN